jgi:hypothetical protein
VSPQFRDALADAGQLSGERNPEPVRTVPGPALHAVLE